MDIDAFVAQALAARIAARPAGSPMVSLLICSRCWAACTQLPGLLQKRATGVNRQRVRDLFTKPKVCFGTTLPAWHAAGIPATSRELLQAGTGSGHSLASSGHSAASLLPQRLWPGSPATPSVPHCKGAATHTAPIAAAAGSRQLPGAQQPQQHARAQHAALHSGRQSSACQSALGPLRCQDAQYEPLAAAAAAGPQQLPHSGAQPAHQTVPENPYTRVHSAAPQAEHQLLDQRHARAGTHQQQRGCPLQQVGQGPTAGQAGWGSGAMQQPAQGQHQTHACQVAELTQSARCSVPSLASAQQPQAGQGCLRGASGGSSSASSAPFAAFSMTASAPPPGAARQQPGPAAARPQHGQQPGAARTIAGTQQPQRQQENAGPAQGSRQQQGPPVQGQQRPVPGQGPLMRAEFQLGPEGYLLLRVAYHERLIAALRR